MHNLHTKPNFIIDGKNVGDSAPIYLIAEAGVNHENDRETAVKMIQEAAAAGADAIKFQSYKAEKLASRHSPSYWDRSKEPASSQFKLFKRYDGFDEKDYRYLAKVAAEHGITFMTTVFDLEFLEQLADIIPAFKVASADITNFPLLKAIASYGKPVILSTGAAYLSEIDQAVRLLESAGLKDIGLLHCVLNYPCEAADAHLKAIPTLAQSFPQAVVGYSDHVPPHHASMQLNLAWMLGARIVEKHFTLDKSLPGNDHYHAMDPEDIRQWRAQHRYMTDLMGEGRLGNVEHQEAARDNARRSLVAARPLKAGERLTLDAVIAKRPASGISPEFYQTVTGSVALCDIPEDTPLQWDMFLKK